MKVSKRLLLPLILAAAAGTTMAQNEPLTRDQVKAELAEAIRTGDLPAGNGIDLKLYQVNPSNYPAKPNAVGKTRDQVKAELAEAIRTGNIVGDSETGAKLNQMVPSRYPAVSTPLGKSRAQVAAETVEARRLGLLEAGDREYPKIATTEQVEQMRRAGLQAISGTTLGQLNPR
jgi:hypothetical protein